jgi:hypothetical protein
MAKYIVVENPVSINGVVFEKGSEVECEVEVAEAYGVEYLAEAKEETKKERVAREKAEAEAEIK